MKEIDIKTIWCQYTERSKTQ